MRFGAWREYRLRQESVNVISAARFALPDPSGCLGVRMLISKSQHVPRLLTGWTARAPEEHALIPFNRRWEEEQELMPTVRQYLCQIIPHVWRSSVLLAQFTSQIKCQPFSSSVRPLEQLASTCASEICCLNGTNTSAQFLHTFLRFGQTCWHC